MKKLMIAMALTAMTTGFSLRADDSKPTTANCPVATGQCAAPCYSRPANCGFDGLNLTDSQKEQIRALRGKHCGNKAQTKRERKEARRAEREAGRKAYLDELKKILTPEQYLQFLENSFTKGRPKAYKGGRHGHHGRHCAPARPCPQAQQCPQAQPAQAQPAQ